ncbi:serine/threonine-protein kinase-like protein At1g28390 [Gastrolobium bilobum]|uniref:serine/threonine-protein kinase-like protein At1g28390 n=1 Tax=Gastrolobium bilobum TaxID=150636 RepID=UPI002AB29BD6|nr:serine/threonine-protein kinase-like protein At1g28390 [Gastrolobium bilobum]
MGYLSCNAESAIKTCDPHCWDLKKKTITRKHTLRKFHYRDLVAATNGFSADSFLGKGSHGRVYRATLDGGNLVVAVKTTKLSSKPTSSRNHATNCTGCGNCTSPAENEIEILSHVPSPRLVNLIGFCTDPNGNKLIVVEYMPNGSLHDLLHSATRPPGWTRRLRFALHVAKAVQALHSSNPPVIHRDIKSSNVLIDENWSARLGDFGLALRGHVEDVRVKCTPPAGTLGYLDPCYLAPEDLSAKSDVFSFGILLLEIISGRNAIDVNYSPPSVVDWAVPLIKRGDFAGICDRRIGTPSDPALIRQLAVLAVRCVRSTAEKRPSMAEVVECLKLLRKRIHASRIWNSLRRRVARVESVRWEEYDCDCDRSSEEVVRLVKGGSRRNRKVSSVPGVGNDSEPISNKVVRSKSIGPGFVSVRGSEIKMRLDLNPDLGGHPQQTGYGFERRKAKMGVMRLNKSKSMGVLQGPLILHNGSENNNNNDPIHSAMSKLVTTSKLERKMLEKPLVNSHWESE